MMKQLIVKTIDGNVTFDNPSDSERADIENGIARNVWDWADLSVAGNLATYIRRQFRRSSGADPAQLERLLCNPPRSAEDIEDTFLEGSLRFCEECGKPMCQGVMDGDAAFCGWKCAGYPSEQAYLDAADEDDEAYWTCWHEDRFLGRSA